MLLLRQGWPDLLNVRVTYNFIYLTWLLRQDVYKVIFMWGAHTCIWAKDKNFLVPMSFCSIYCIDQTSFNAMRIRIITGNKCLLHLKWEQIPRFDPGPKVYKLQMFKSQDTYKQNYTYISIITYIFCDIHFI